MDEEAEKHDLLGAMGVRQHRSDEAAGDAHQGENRDYHPGLHQAYPPVFSYERRIDEDDTVTCTSQGVDRGQVPEGPSPPYVLIEHLGPKLLRRLVPDDIRWIVLGGSVWLETHVGGKSTEDNREQKDDSSPDRPIVQKVSRQPTLTRR